MLDNRSFGGVLVSRTFYAKGQTGQQLLLGAYSAMNRQIGRGKIKMYSRHEMLDLVKVDGKVCYGQVVGLEAMAAGISVAKKYGMSSVAVKNSHHLLRENK